jgi:hypothetical protein
VLPILLSVVAIAAWRSFSSPTGSAGRLRAELRDNPVVLYGLLAVVALWLTLGTPFGLWKVARALPAFTFIRVPSRFSMLEFLALAVLAGFGFERLTRGLRRGTASVAALLAMAILIAEFFAAPLELRLTVVERPAAERWLAQQAKPFAMAEVPVPDSLSEVTQALWETRYMLHSTAHWQKTIHGYSGVDTPGHIALRNALTRFPDEASLTLLADRGVDWVIVHPQLYAESERADAEARIAQYADRLVLAFTSPDGRVYRLRTTDRSAPK